MIARYVRHIDNDNDDLRENPELAGENVVLNNDTICASSSDHNVHTNTFMFLCTCVPSGMKNRGLIRFDHHLSVILASAILGPRVPLTRRVRVLVRVL